MLLYRVLDRPYEDPRKSASEKAELLKLAEKAEVELAGFSGGFVDRIVEKTRLMGGADSFARFINLQRVRRLGHFATNREHVIQKHGSSSGVLLVLDVPDAEVDNYPADHQLVGPDFAYGVVYDFPDDAPYEPEVKPLNRSSDE